MIMHRVTPEHGRKEATVVNRVEPWPDLPRLSDNFQLTPQKNQRPCVITQPVRVNPCYLRCGYMAETVMGGVNMSVELKYKSDFSLPPHLVGARHYFFPKRTMSCNFSG